MTQCEYKGCEQQDVYYGLSYMAGPFQIHTLLCNKHRHEFDNFLEKLKAYNISWNTDLK